MLRRNAPARFNVTVSGEDPAIKEKQSITTLDSTAITNRRSGTAQFTACTFTVHVVALGLGQ